MKISFVAGFGPIIRDADESRAFWGNGLGITLAEPVPGYWTNDDLEGVRAFALWPLDHASVSCFGSAPWPADIPAPRAWVELDVESPEAVETAVNELRHGGHRVLRGAQQEPWGQTTSRLLSPEGLLVGVTYTPWMHTAGGQEPSANA